MNNNMDICRICLKSNVEKDIHELENDIKRNDKSYADIIKFCLGIQIMEPSNISTKLCSKCYKKTLSFYKFKSLALKNDVYLRSLDPDSNIKYEVFIRDDDIKEEVVSLNDQDFLENDIKSDVDVLDGLGLKGENYQSDDELLSTIKSIKYELIVEDSKENAPVKRRGQKKKLKSIVKIEKDQVCDECGKTVRNLKEHMLCHQPDRKQLKCKDCDKTFSSYSARYKHYKVKHLGIKKHCNECNKDVADLRQHYLVIHNREGLRFVCVSCGVRCISQSSLDLHVTTHTKDRPYECEHCGKRYRSKLQLSQHIRQVHDKEKSHLCQFCSKSYFKKYHLQIHLRSHTREKPHSCPICNKAFSSTTILRNHMYVHSKVKAFGCDFCDMKFSRPGYLRAHMVSHTKEKRYPCKYCGVAFGRSDHRKRHQYTAHEKHLTADVTK